MKKTWKIFALLESSCGVLLSVLAVILDAFVLTAGGAADLAHLIAWGGVALALALTLVAHGQLIGTFRRKPVEVAPQPGSIALPILVVAVLAAGVGLVGLAGPVRWADFARLFLTYTLVPPAVFALACRALVAWSLRRMSEALNV